MSRLPIIILLLLAGVNLTMCHRDSSAYTALQEASTLLRSDPARVGHILDSLERGASLTSPRDSACHALVRLHDRYYLDIAPDETDDSLAALAEPFFRESAANRKSLMLTLFIKGYNSIFRDDLASGVIALLEAEEIASDLNESFWLGQSRFHIGKAYEKVFEFNTALSYYRKMREAFSEFGDSLYIDDARNVLAVAYLNTGQLSEARTLIEDMIRDGRRTADTMLIARGYDKMAIYFARLEIPDSVVAYYDRAAALDTDILDRHSVFNYVNALIAIGRGQEVESLLGRKGWSNCTLTDIPAQYWKLRNDYKRAYDYMARDYSEVDNLLLLSDNKGMTPMVSEYWKEKRDFYRFRSIILSGVIILMICCAIFGGICVFIKIRKTNRKYISAKRQTQALKEGLDKGRLELDLLREKVAGLRDNHSELLEAKKEIFAKDDHISAIEERLQQLDELTSVQQHRMLQLVGMRYKELNRLYDVLRSGKNMRNGKDTFTKELEVLLADLKGSGNINLLANYIDYYTDGLYEHFVADFPGLSADDYAIVIYSTLGIPSSIVSALTGISESTIRVRKTRLRKRIQESPSQYKDLYLSMLSYKKE